MAYRIKYDIGTAVSVALVVGKNPTTGEDIEQEEIFLPGAVLPSNVAKRITHAVDRDDAPNHDHLSALIEKIDGREARAVEADPDKLPSPPQQQPEDTPGAPSVPGFPASNQPAIAAQQQSAGGPTVEGAGAAGTVDPDNPFAPQAEQESEPETPAPPAAPAEPTRSARKSGGN
jgi:hypothetical protein